MLTVGMAELVAGKLDAARQATLEARACFEVSGNIYGTRATLFVLGEASTRQGELHQAASLYRQVLAEAGEDPLDRGSALVNVALLSYEWNELEAAEQQASQELELGKQYTGEVGKYHAEQSLQVPGSLVLARVLHARGENAQAQQVLQELIALTQERRWPHLHREVLACQAQMSISVGDLAAAQRWSNTCTQLGEDFRLVQREREALIVARLLIAQGEAEEALRLLERWQADAHTQGRAQSVLETQVLTALPHFSDNHLPQARHTHIQALPFCRAQRYH